MARIDEIQEAPPQRSKFMDYFSKAGNIVINGGQFIMDNRKFVTVKPLKPKFDKRHGIETLDVQNIDLDGEIIGVRNGTGLQRGILLRTGEAIVVRTFEGKDARQARDRYIKESIGIFHSNHLNIVGISSKRSPHSFVVYQGGKILPYSW
ncbi:hypothetical protein MKEN_00191600 [Mycena kentingensis (nom. inval.)]|nr:hypothetical protein MKEN_00191600 [Mycena kentingensis (nom. inval.)]